MIGLLALLLAAGDGLTPARVHDGGVCAGLSWVTLAPGETAAVLRGPDFDVLYFHGPGGANDRSWGIYSGRAANVGRYGPVLLEVNGVVVHRVMKDDQFIGYLADKNGLQNHVFGAVLAGTDADRKLFERIDFSEAGQANCAK